MKNLQYIFLGWEFVDNVMTSRQTFSGFVTVISNRYRRFSPNDKFMSLKTFIDFFFAWASRMKIEFREKCPGCEESPSYLACDGTKLGINFRNTFVSPVETTTYEVDSSFVQKKRHDRCLAPETKTNVYMHRTEPNLRILLCQVK